MASRHRPRRSPPGHDLTYVNDHDPGIRRARPATGFDYLDAEGQPVARRQTLDRIRKLAIPPAWTEVWIAPTRAATSRPTGRDAKGRKQYRYHDRWRADRDEAKYDRLIAFGRALPQAARAGRARPRPPRPAPREGAGRRGPGAGDHPDPRRQRGIRQDQQELRPDHAARPARPARRRRARCSSSAARAARCTRPASRPRAWPASSRPARTCPASGCSSTSTTTASGTPSAAADVNAYLREAHGRGLLRQGLPHLGRHPRRRPRAGACSRPARATTQAKKNVNTCVKAVAGVLGNTAAVCRKAYIHPAVFDASEAGVLDKRLTKDAPRRGTGAA